ncbi:MAG: sterol desaturase family protein [Acetobacterales bacterium]
MTMDETGLAVLIGTAAGTVAKPFLAFIQQESFLYWPYLATALVVALLAGLWAGRQSGKPFGEYLKDLFSPSIWWHRSARVDYRFYVVNGIVFPLIFTPMIVTGFYVAQGTQWALSSLFGASPVSAELGLWALVIYSVVFFVAYDLGRWVGHSVQHQIPFLWEFHKVHHSAEVLTPITSFRAHPVDLLIMATVAGQFTGLVSGGALFLFERDIGLLTVLNLHFLVFFYNLVSNLRHSHVWLSYGRLGYIFISPAQHQIHHSDNPKHFGMNRGFGLAVWDWMFGTLYVPRQREELSFGTADGTEKDYCGVWQLYWLPVRRAFATLARRPAPGTEREAARVTTPAE